MGVEVLHSGQDGPEQRCADGQLHGGQVAAERDAEGDPDHEHREAGGQAGDGLGAGPGMEDPLEEQDGHVRRRPGPGPEQQRSGHQHFGIRHGQDVAQFVPCRPGPLGAVGLSSGSGRRRLTHEGQHGQSGDDEDHGRHLEGQVPRGWVGLLPGGDDGGLDGPAGQGAEQSGEQEGFQPPAATEHLGHDGHIGEGEHGGRLAGDDDEQNEGPVARHHGEHPRGRPHQDEAARHVRRAAPDPGLGPVAEATGHRVGDPAEEAVGGQGEGDGQRSRGPLLDEQGDEHPRDSQVGPRADLAVSGVLITLFVQQRASGALAVTFALTANRLLSWITYPVAGRLSDRTKSRVGRRTPYMAGSLILMGISTWMFTVVSGYWLLVLFIVIARQAAAVFTLTNVAVVPEVFGRSRWIKALLLTTLLGTLASWTIKATVITTWKQSDPATWNLPFQVAAVILVVTGLAVLALVREAPSAAAGAETDRTKRARPARDELRDILAGPNAKVLVAGSLLFWAGTGSTAYVAILFFQRILHAGASAQTIAGLATGLPVFMIGIALGVPLSRYLSPMQLAIGAPLLGAVLAGVQYFDTHLWQAVVLGYIGAPFVGAYLIVMAPLLLQLLPRLGRLGERLGVLLAPFNLCSVILAYVAAIVIDATGNYRLIWLFPAATGLGHALVNCWLKYPERRSTSPDMVKRLWEWAIVQAESMAETGIVAGLLAAPLLGVVTEADADSAVVVDMARNILGNPYADLDETPQDGPADDEPDGGGQPA